MLLSFLCVRERDRVGDSVLGGFIGVLYLCVFYVVVCFSNPGRGWNPGGTGFDSHSPVVEEKKL